MTGNELFHSYKMFCLFNKLPSRGKYDTYKQLWDELAEALDNNNISKKEFLDFIFAKIARPYPHVIFAKVGNKFKYLEMYKQLAKTNTAKKILQEDTKKEIREQLYKMRVWLAIASAELTLRQKNKHHPDISEYSDSVYLMANEYSPIYLAYLYQSGGFLEGYNANGLDRKLLQALGSREIRKYFDIVEEIMKTDTTKLLATYRKRYKEYNEKLKLVEEPFKKINVITMGSIRYF